MSFPVAAEYDVGLSPMNGDFKNYLIIMGENEIFPMNFIKADTYEATPDQMLDVDPKRDSTGVLHRNVLQHTATIIKFSTMPLTGLQHDYLMDLIHRNMTNTEAHEIDLTYWDDNWHTYKSGTFYMVDPVFHLKMIHPETLERMYQPTELEFIEY